MSFPQPPYHADSDADDEYERSVVASPRLPPDSDISPSDSEPPSVEHTPTTYGNSGEDRSSPRTIITEWTAEECADFLGGLGLHTYCDTFLENDIIGEALVALKHDELKEMGISSVGHRLTILKSVYETKVKQDVPVDPDHYVPLSVEQSMMNEPVTQEDFTRMSQSIRQRDERIISAEAELRKLAEDYRRLREELLPVFKMAKDRSQPLPYQPRNGGSNNGPEYPNEPIVTSPVTTQPEKLGSSLSRTFSKKLFLGGTTPKNNSPTHIPQSIPEGRAYNDNSTLDPSAAAMAASSHLTASMNGGSQPSPKNHGNIPSPTSPANFYPQQTLGARSYSREGTSTTTSSRTLYDHSEEPQSYSKPERSNPTPTPQTARQDPPNSASGNQGSRNANSNSNNDPSAPSVEIFKTFRVSMDDPCHKVLPAALKKYQINADWQQYALYIVYGDQERCLGLEERPLILFKQLDKEGRKPMFMLRKHTQPVEGHTSSVYGAAGAGAGGAGQPGSANTDGSGGGVPGSAGGRGLPNQSAIHLPGGVL